MFLDCSPFVYAFPIKTCSKCGEAKPTNREHFPSRPDGRLYGYCTQCDNRRGKIWREANRELKAEIDRKWNEKNRERKSASVKAWREKNREYRKDYERNWAKEKGFAYKDKRRKLNAAWSKANSGKRRAAENRRRARKKQLPDTFTVTDWRTALDFFDECCAVCGQHLNGMFHSDHQDHWIPLASPDCPGTVPYNMVPLCSNCNLSKNDRLPTEWLNDKFGKRKGLAILKRIEAFLESRKPQE